jgi:hypothetical protein
MGNVNWKNLKRNCVEQWHFWLLILLCNLDTNWWEQKKDPCYKQRLLEALVERIKHKIPWKFSVTMSIETHNWNEVIYKMGN